MLLNRKYKLTLGLSILTLTNIALADSASSQMMKSQQKIHNRLTAMGNCWNHQDLKCVAYKFYAKDAIYPSSQGPLVGPKAIYKDFLKRFSHSHKLNLGKLSFTESNYHQLGASAALNIVHYKLLLNGKVDRGYSTLTWIKKNDVWRILSDQPKSIKRS
jgi:hypothetical protein